MYWNLGKTKGVQLIIMVFHAIYIFKLYDSNNYYTDMKKNLWIQE